MQLHGLEVQTTSDSHFAWIRTRLSLERTPARGMNVRLPRPQRKSSRRS
jgi:hypothetical protein